MPADFSVGPRRVPKKRAERRDVPARRAPSIPQQRTGPVRQPAPRTAVTRAPVSDVQSSGGDYGTRRAERFKRTPEYRRSVRVAREAERQRKSARYTHRGTPQRTVSGDGRNLLDDLFDATYGAVYGVGRPKRKVSDSERGRLNVGGGPGSATVNAATGSSGAPRVLKNLGRGFATDPGGFTSGTLKAAQQTLYGIPASALRTLTDTVSGTKEGDPLRGVKRSASEYVTDLLERAAETDAEQVERFATEGALPEALDAATLLTGGGAAAGRVLTGVARTGRLGEGPRRTVAEPRRQVRTTGGATREQELSRNYFVAARQKRRDERSVRGQERTISRADERARRTAAARDVTDAPRRGQVDAVVREATARGEVVPSRAALPGLRMAARPVELRRAPSARKLERAGGREYAGEKGRTLLRLRSTQGREIRRGVDRNIAQLDRNEKRAFKYALALGATSAAAGAAALRRQVDLIRANRADEAAVGADELPVIAEILKAPEKHFTERLAGVVRDERERGGRVAELDPDLSPERARLRREKPQLENLGVERRGTPIREAVKGAREDVVRARGRRRRAEARVAVAERRSERSRGAAEVRVGQSETVRRRQLERAERAVQLHRRSALNHQLAGRKPEAKAAAARMARAQERARALKAAEETRPVRTLSRLQRREAAALEARKSLERTRVQERAARARLKDLQGRRSRGARLGDDAEAIEAWLERGRQAREAEGLEEPGYFPSEPRSRTMFAMFAPGGSKGVVGDRRYGGELFRTGRESNNPLAYRQAIARNIKRHFNWNLVGHTFERHSFEWGRNKTVGEALAEIERRGIDPESVALWSPGVYRKRRDEFEQAGGQGEERTGGQEPDLGAGIHEALTDKDGATVSPERLSELARSEELPDEAWVRTQRFSILPRGVYDEVIADTKPSGKFGRALDVIVGKQARILLGTSPPWLMFQVASNAMLAGLAGAKPWDVAGAVKWWRGLTDEQREAIEPYIGVGSFHDSIQQTKMGAAAKGGMINAYRAFKESAFWQQPRRVRGARGRTVAVADLNPLDWLFRLDEKQNNAFRRLVFYSQAKRDAYGRMGRNTAAMQRLHDRLVPQVLGGKSPDIDVLRLAENAPELERLAGHVNDFLGDYLTYTAKERRALARPIMFYGYMRFSLRFTFLTMPRKHPVMTSIIAQLGRLEAEEIRKLMKGQDLPWAMGRFYFRKNGELQEIDLSRMNPALNAVTQIQSVGETGPYGALPAAIRLMPPMAVMALDQAFSTSSFTGRRFRVGGETQPRKEFADYGIPERTRILVENAASLVGYYRTADAATSDGRPEGVDSGLLVGRRPTQYKRADIVASIEADRARRPQSAAERALLQLVPFIPRRSNVPEIAAKIAQANGEAAPAAPLTPEQRREYDRQVQRAQRAAQGSQQVDQAEFEKLQRRAALAAAQP